MNPPEPPAETFSPPFDLLPTDLLLPSGRTGGRVGVCCVEPEAAEGS